ncbi:phage head morphogenesis protein, partial [Enterococcus faecium]
VFDVDEMEPGTNAPNMHPFCRCSTAPYVDRDAFEKSLKERGL